ncbi:amino acid adenylation domain-containing protein [Nostoc sp. CCY0012]|uniref:amino acid adenylation domain-containing protein n=1 Tax=Nostoc sp. CCY0012 TaxID=1056123 RepID=UPI0039C742E5
MQAQIIEGVKLSPLQKHLWLSQQQSSNFSLRVQCTVLIEGNLDTHTLQKAIHDVINRHEILRTQFQCLPGMQIPVQVINNQSKLNNHDYDLSSLQPQQQNTKIDEIFQEMLQSPFNYEQGELLHICLITLSPHKYKLILGLPALCADSITLRNLVREISNSYTACLHNESLTNEIMQYADIAEWQNELLEADDTEIGREYWRTQDFSHVLHVHLPLENQFKVNTEFQPQIVGLKIAPNLTSQIETLAQKYDISVSVILLACWQILLMRLTEQPEMIIGTAYDGRQYEELEEILGLFAKYLPLNCNLSETSLFSDVVCQINQRIQELDEWQASFDWEQVQEGSNQGISSSFFPFCFDFEGQKEQYYTESICFSIEKQYNCIDRFKVKCSCREQSDFLNIEFYYDSNLFDAEDINRLAGEFETLLQSICNQPSSVISELEILKPIELKKILGDFNCRQNNYPKNQCIHHLFEEQVKCTPNNIAVAFKNQQLTYFELNNHANQLAHHLQKLGIKPDMLVGICTENSLQMFVGILGILKAGAAYLPLDPTYPQERLAFLLSDTQTPILLTQQHLAPSLPQHQAKTIYLDSEWETIASHSRENPVVEMSPENLAYVIYTSGSTGKPKGVQITHENLVHSTNTRINYYQEPVKGFLLLSSFAFDSSIAGIFWTICQGGSLVLPQAVGEQDLSELIELITQKQITHILSLPSFYNLLLEYAQQTQLASLHTVIVAGEPCPKTLVTRHLELLPKTFLFNEYGPTEGTVWSSVYKCEALPSRTQVSIGHAIANTQIYILDASLRPVPIGVAGELYISGDGLARGYLHQPHLTAEKFIPNPFSNQPGKRLYKTGDLGRYLPDGNIEFLGRTDNQVKIRGFRIELGEIEAVLSQHPQVRSLAVIATDEESGNKRLIAYLVPQSQSLPSTSDLRQFLEEKLPSYMVPSAFVQLDNLPRLPNGKVDIKALPAPEQIRAKSGTFVAPSTPTEKLLADIWTQVLRVERLGIHDNFFELGGDSILSIQIIAKANQAGLQLVPKQIFDNQTIAKLAAVAGTVRTIQAEQGLVTGEVYLTPIQHWFFEQNQPQPHHWNQAFLLEMRQHLDTEILQQVMQQLILHHDALRLHFVKNISGWQQAMSSDKPLCVYAPPTDIFPVTRYDFSTLSQQEQEKAIASTATKLQASFHLSQSPLVQAAIFDRGANQPSYLLIVIHHLAVDGVSWRILLEDFQTVYTQLQAGKTIKLPAKTTSFQQWAQKLRNYAQSAELQTELEYWCAESRQQISPIPVDFPAGENTEASARTISVSLSVAETQALLQKVPAAYETQINDVLLAALVRTFAEWTGNSYLLVNLEGHGREEIFDDVDLSRTVGWFTTIFPVSLNLGEVSDLAEVLQTVKHQLRAIPNRGLGYGVLRYLSTTQLIKEQLQSLPEAEILFNYLGQTDQILAESSVFRPSNSDIGPSHSLRGSRRYLLDINAIVSQGQLQVSWTYSEAIHRQATIEHLAARFIEALQQMIDHCVTLPDAKLVGGTGYTPSKELLATLSADSILDPTIRPDGVPVDYTIAPASILLTGTTGFVGAFLLHELLQKTTADIYCLVRASNVDSAKKRIKQNLESYLLWNESLSSRIIPVAGDLSLPLLGLDNEQFLELAKTIDLIYHNAAFINLVYPYSVVRAANVLGTHEILRLASLTKTKPLHFMSTLSVFDCVDSSGGKPIEEVDNLNDVPVPYIGYVQSKWVAEKLVVTARERGLPVAIYRLGRMSGSSQTGVSNTKDFLHRTIKGLIQLGSVPDADAMVDMTPVDFVSQAIVRLSQKKASLGKAFHVCNPQPIELKNLIKWLCSFGYSIQEVSYDKWQSILKEKWQADLRTETDFHAESPLHSLVLLFPEKQSKEQNANSAMQQIDCQNMLTGLENTSIICPPVDKTLLDTYFSYLVNTGFLDAPQPAES